MLGTLGSRLSGLVRQGVINTFPPALTDAFLVASRVPNLLRELLAEGALVNSFIPVYKSLPDADRRKLAGAVTGVLIAVNLLLLAFGVLAAPLLADLLLSAKPNVDRDTVVYMTRLVMPFLMLVSLYAIAMGILNADEHFRESSFGPIAFNIATIAMLLVLPHSATWLAVGWIVGGVAQLLIQIPALRKYGLLPRPSLRGHRALRRVLVNMVPFTLTAGARQFLNLVVTNFLSSSQFPRGTITGYANAETIFQMSMGLFVMSPALAIFPRFAALRAEGDWKTFRALTLSTIRSVVFLSAPISALLCVLAPYAVSVLMFSGDATGDKFRAGSLILSTWSLALVPWGINTILLRTFYAREKTREAVAISAVSFVCEVGLYALLTPAQRLGLAGFGVASTIMGIATCVALTAMYRAQLGFPLKQLFAYLARVLPLALVAGLIAWAVTRVLPQPGRPVPGALGFGVASAIGLAAYLGLAVALRVPEVSGVTRRLLRR
nr:murein biosynthesis integral membrane protein MurJ [Deinococcus yavapaiensis]